MSNKIFLLGVGCQKGGTSWLYDYLQKHPQADMGFQKEYHILDGLYSPECRHFYDRILRLARQGLSSPEFLAGETGHYVLKKLDFYRDLANYFDYFESLYHRSERVKLVGDITPSYSSVSVAGFQEARSRMLQRGLKPRVVFLMRDPLERCWSVVRMARRDRDPARVPFASEQEELASYFRSRECEIRTRYDQTVKNLRAAFAESELYVDFYENLFTQSTIGKLCQFLEIDFVPANLQQRVNDSGKQSDIADGLKAEIVDFYSDVYRWAAAEFGAGQIKSLWANARFCNLG